MHIVGADGVGNAGRGSKLETEARETGIIEELRLENAMRNPQRSASMFDLILYEKCRAEPNLTLMLNTAVVGAVVEGSRITRAIAERQSTEDRFEIEARIFIDCTGDGRLGYEAGAAFMEGTEDREQFGESLAPTMASNQRLGSTILLQARKHDQPMPFRAPDWARRFSKQDLRLRLYATPGGEEPTHEYGYWWAEWGGLVDTIKDNETIRDELLAIALGIWDHVKNGPPGTEPGADPFRASHWALDWFGFLPGKRESRRFIGLHVLTESDVMESRPFEDAIAYGGWSIDIHPPEGVDAPDQEPCVQHPVPHLYDIPLSSCVSASISNLMFAGRDMSATHVAFASTRVMATCAVVGQGVGTASAYAVKQDIDPCKLSGSGEMMQAIQQQLLSDDCYLVGRTTAISEPMRRVRLLASSEQEDGAAENIRSGQTRAVHGPKGAPPDRSHPGTHRWMSDPAQGFPAWLLLEWDEPVTLREIQLIFDTGLHRQLTLSHHDGYTATMQWGRPQPETVSDYDIEGRTDGQWQVLVQERGNYLRLRRHELNPDLPLDSLRITALQSHGLDHARIVAISLKDS
jgi:hypothetical protein